MFEALRTMWKWATEPMGESRPGPYAYTAQAATAPYNTNTYGGSDKMGAMSEQLFERLVAQIDELPPAEAKAELAFLVRWIHDNDQGEYNDPEKWWGPQGIKWLLLHGYFGMIPTQDTAAPWSKNEMEPIMRFMAKAPNSLQARMLPLYEDFREICAVREEKKLITAARANPNGSSNGSGQSHADQGPKSPYL